jgi:hypothetical protein
METTLNDPSLWSDEEFPAEHIFEPLMVTPPDSQLNFHFHASAVAPQQSDEDNLLFFFDDDQTVPQTPSTLPTAINHDPVNLVEEYRYIPLFLLLPFFKAYILSCKVCRRLKNWKILW